MAVYLEFQSGIVSLGLWDVLVSNAGAADALLVHSISKLTVAAVKGLYKVE